MQVLSALPELKELVRQKSAALARELATYDGDTCMCVQCIPAVVPKAEKVPEQAPPPSKRLRSKTAQ